MGSTASVEQKINEAISSLQSAISDIIVKNSNFVNNTQAINQMINVTFSPTSNIVGCNLEFKQTAKTAIASAVSGSLQSSTTITNALDNAIKNTVNQIAEAAAEALGGKANVVNTTNIKVVLKSIISNNVNVENIAQTMNHQIINQGENVIFEGNITCTKDQPVPTISFDQDAASNIVAKQVTSTISKQIMNNKEIARIVQSVKQEGKAESKGIWTIILMIVAILGLVVVMKLMKVNPYIILGLMVLLIILVIVMRVMYIWPFKKPSYWGCAISKDGLMTGKCQEYDNDKVGPYASQEQCEQTMSDGTSLNCPSYFGFDCDLDPSTASCKQYKDLGGADGSGAGIASNPFYSLDDCKKNGASACAKRWACDPEGGKGCKQLSWLDAQKVPSDMLYSSQQECESKAKCDTSLYYCVKGEDAKTKQPTALCNVTQIKPPTSNSVIDGKPECTNPAGCFNFYTKQEDCQKVCK